MSPGITAFLVFCAAVFSTLALALVWEVIRDALKRREVARRLKPVLNEMDPEARARSDSIVRQFEGEGSILAEFFKSLPGIGRVETLIRDARVDWRPESFLLVSVGLAMGLGGAVFLLSDILLLGVFAAVIGVLGPYLYLRRKATMRLRTFEEEFPEAIELLTRAIRAGHPLASGMRMVGDEGPPVVAEEFQQTFEEQRFGLPFNDALLGMVDRVDLVDVRIFAIAVLIQREVGGNLAEILDNLAETIRGRFYIRRQLRVYTAQGRMSGYALAALPIVVGSITFLLDPDYLSLLFTTTMGRLMVITAMMLQVIGVFWIRKIINIDI
jgi:tight adherence protein B